MRDEDAPFLAGYDQDAWAVERDYAHDDLRRAADGFARHRADHVELLGDLSPDEWERTGRHEELGEVTILGQAIHLATHDVQHLAQIARALRDAR